MIPFPFLPSPFHFFLLFNFKTKKTSLLSSQQLSLYKTSSLPRYLYCIFLSLQLCLLLLLLSNRPFNPFTRDQPPTAISALHCVILILLQPTMLPLHDPICLLKCSDGIFCRRKCLLTIIFKPTVSNSSMLQTTFCFSYRQPHVSLQR